MTQQLLQRSNSWYPSASRRIGLMDDQEHLIQKIESYCNAAGIAESTFGRQAVNDGKFVGRLRARKSITTSTVAKVRQFLTDRQRPLNETHVELPQKNRFWTNPVEQPLLKSSKLNKPALLSLQKSIRYRGKSPERDNFVSTTTGKNTCFLSTHAARNGR